MPLELKTILATMNRGVVPLETGWGSPRRSQFGYGAPVNVGFARPFQVTVAFLRFDAMAD